MKQPKQKTFKALDYHECIKWIEHVYEVDTRDYAGKYSKKEVSDETPYLDFWHHLLDEYDGCINNGCFLYICFDEILKDYNQDEEKYELWQIEIYNMFWNEFKQYADRDGVIKFWIAW